MALLFSAVCNTVPISLKPVAAERDYVDIFYAGFNPNWPINIENASGNYLMSSSTL
jgi:hypothetical protein